MKKAYLTASILVMTCTFVAASASIAMAENDQPTSSQPGFGPGMMIRQDIQNQYQGRMQNAKNNQDYRNTMMASSTGPWKEWDNGSSTRPFPPFMVPFMRRFASTTDFASTTFMERAMEERGHADEMRADMFAWVQNNLVDQLNRALGNIEQIRARIADRIQADTASGTDMTDASNLLSIADQKIDAAKTAIQSLASYLPSSTSTPYISATSTVGVGHARLIGSGAIQAMKDARDALQKVVVAIAHAMGLKLDGDEHASSTSDH